MGPARGRPRAGTALLQADARNGKQEGGQVEEGARHKQETTGVAAEHCFMKVTTLWDHSG